MRRQYFIHYYRDFCNTYNLLYADTEDDLKLIPKDAERITRKEAEGYARDEKQRQRHDHNFSGFADSAIFPVNADPDYDWRNGRKYQLNGLIWEKVHKCNYRVVNMETGDEVSEAFDTYEEAWRAMNKICNGNLILWKNRFVRSQLVE